MDSFEAELSIKGLDKPFVGVFIRAPHIVKVGDGVEVLAEHEGKIVAAREGQFLGCSFHPELTDDHRLTELFVNMVRESVVVITKMIKDKMRPSTFIKALTASFYILFDRDYFFLIDKINRKDKS